MNLFRSPLSRDPVLDAIAQADNTEWRDWCDKWRALHELLQNQHLVHTHSIAQYTHPEAAKEWAEGNGASYRFFPLVRMMAERLAIAFHRPPDTYLHRGDFVPLPETDAQVVQWRIDERHIRLPLRLKLIEELVIVLGQAVVQPSWQAGRMRWDVYPPYNARVAPSAKDPTSFMAADAVQLRLHRPKRVLRTEPDLWLSWERDEAGDWVVWVRTAAGAKQDAGLFASAVNEYGMHPVVLWQFTEPDDGDLWVPPDEVLLQHQRTINVDITDLHYGLRYCSHPQLVEYGNALDSKQPTIGPGRLRRYPDVRDNKFEAVTPELNTATQRDSIEWQLQLYAISLGFPPDTFSANSSTRNLGAKQHEALQLQIRRESIYPAAKWHLEDTFDRHRVVANYWAAHGAKRTLFDPDVKLGVNLMPVPAVSDRLQEEQARLSEIPRGLSSNVEQEMEDSGVSRPEAAARIARRLSDTASTSAATPPAPRA